MDKIHPDLKGKVRANRYIGVPIFGMIALGVFVKGAHAIATGSESPAELILMASVGMIFLWAVAYVWRSAAWYERITKTLKETDPISAKLHFKKNQAGAPLVTLIPMEPEDYTELQILCGDTQWDFNKLKDTIVKVHVDPKSDGSAVIETPFGIVWPLERQIVKRIKPEAHIYRR